MGSELGEPAGELAQGQETGAWDAGDLVFVGLAHIDEFDAGLGLIESALELLDGGLVGV